MWRKDNAFDKSDFITIFFLVVFSDRDFLLKLELLLSLLFPTEAVVAFIKYVLCLLLYQLRSPRKYLWC